MIFFFTCDADCSASRCLLSIYSWVHPYTYVMNDFLHICLSILESDIVSECFLFCCLLVFNLPFKNNSYLFSYVFILCMVLQETFVNSLSKAWNLLSCFLIVMYNSLPYYSTKTILSYHLIFFSKYFVCKT